MLKRITALVAAAFLLGGCAFFDPAGRSILAGGSSLTASIQNPVGLNELAAVEAAYQAALVAAVNYRRFCYSDKIENLPSVCAKRREMVLTMQAAQKRVKPALVALRYFVRNNDTVNAISALNYARQAVMDFQATASSYGVN